MNSPSSNAAGSGGSKAARTAEAARLDRLSGELLSRILTHPRAGLSLQDKIDVEACCEALRKALPCDVPGLWENVTLPSHGEVMTKGIMDQQALASSTDLKRWPCCSGSYAVLQVQCGTSTLHRQLIRKA